MSDSFAKCSVALAKGDDRSGAENLCKAVTNRFPGLSAELVDAGKENPSGFAVGIYGGDRRARNEILKWLELNREKYCKDDEGRR